MSANISTNTSPTSLESNPQIVTTNLDEISVQLDGIPSLQSENKDVNPSVAVKRVDTGYWLRSRRVMDYKKLTIDYSSNCEKKETKAVCEQCFRQNCNDIHLDIEDDNKIDIDFVIKSETVPNSVVTVYQVMTDHKIKRKYLSKRCEQRLKF